LESGSSSGLLRWTRSLSARGPLHDDLLSQPCQPPGSVLC
jgi:hypothetical protein